MLVEDRDDATLRRNVEPAQTLSKASTSGSAQVDEIAVIFTALELASYS
jgi:hypothetical protein